MLVSSTTEATERLKRRHILHSYMSEVDLLAARVAALESEHSTTTETIATNQSELNAFYLMWAGVRRRGRSLADENLP